MAQTDYIQKTSEAARILIPLLDALKWKGEASRINQFLGGQEEDLDVHGLIDIMANLNFKHQHLKQMTIRDLDRRLLPVLVVHREHYVLILKMDDLHALIYDANEASFRNIAIQEIMGDFYTFTYVSELKDSLIHDQANWFTKLAFRFSRSFKQLAFLTLLLTLLDLLIPLFVILIYDQIGTSKSEGSLIILFIGVILYFAFGSILDFMRSMITNYISIRMGNVISQQTFRKLMYLPPSYTETASISSQINRIRDFENLKRFTNSGIFLNLLELVFSVIYVLAIFVLGGWLGFIPIVTLIVVLILGAIMKPFHKAKMELSATAKSDHQQTLLEILKNTEEIKSSSMKDHWIRRHKDGMSKSILRKYEQQRFVASSNNLIYFVTNASVITLIYGGVLQVFDGLMSLGALIGIVLLYWKVLASIRGATSLFVQVNGLKKSIQQINRFMKLPQDTSLKANMVVTKEVMGGVTFKDVSIRYNKTSKAALINVNFTVKPGEIMGISGHDGAGKTTILKLIMAMYIPQGGRIQIDQWNVKQLEPLTLRQHIAYAPERDIVFTGSVRANFKQVNPSIQDDDILDLMAQTGMDDYMTALKYTLDTIIDEDMISELSPSFKKLFCLTRLLAREVNLYLVDEPENHLDHKELTRILSVFKELSFHKKTVIVTSKNELVLNICHKQIDLNQGRGKTIKGGSDA